MKFDFVNLIPDISDTRYFWYRIFLIFNISDTQYFRYLIFLIPNISDTRYFWYQIFLIPDISDTQYFWFLIFLIPDISDTWYFWNPIFIIPDINDTQYIWYFWYMNLFLIPNRGHYYAACAIFIRMHWQCWWLNHFCTGIIQEQWKNNIEFITTLLTPPDNWKNRYFGPILLSKMPGFLPKKWLFRK